MQYLYLRMGGNLAPALLRAGVVHHQSSELAVITQLLGNLLHLLHHFSPGALAGDHHSNLGQTCAHRNTSFRCSS